LQRRGLRQQPLLLRQVGVGVGVARVLPYLKMM
jgi:hypothetical protein